MPPYLVSFTTPGRLELEYGSHVVDLPEAPATAEAVVDLETSLGMEYGPQSILLLTWDLLPDESTHPVGSGPYCYFLTYYFTSGGRTGHRGSTDYLSSKPICTLADLRIVEEDLRSHAQAQEVHLVSCKPLRGPTPQLLQAYTQKWPGDNPN